MEASSRGDKTARQIGAEGQCRGTAMRKCPGNSEQGQFRSVEELVLELNSPSRVQEGGGLAG